MKITPAAGSAAAFGFDALGRNKSRTVGVTTDTYGYVGAGDTVFALAGGASTRLSAFDLSGSRISVKDGSTVGYLVPDLHGSVVATETAGSSAIASALRYDGYGRTVAVAMPGGTVALDHRYTGALDLAPDASPLYAIGARDYSPASGAWTSLDTYGGQAQAPASMNRFLYAQANPTTFIDPSGHFAQKADERVPTPEAKQRIQKNIEQYGNANGYAGGANYDPADDITLVPGAGVTDERTNPYTLSMDDEGRDFVSINTMCRYNPDAPLCASYPAAYETPIDCELNREYCELRDQATVLTLAVMAELVGTAILVFNPIPGDEVAAGGLAAGTLAALARVKDRMAVLLGRKSIASRLGFGPPPVGGGGVDHIVLGFDTPGLRDMAATVGGRTLLRDPEWRTTLQVAIGDPTTRFTVRLDGMTGTSTYSQVMSAAQRGAAGAGGNTDWEMAQLLQGGRLGEVTFMRGGSVVSNPWAQP